MKHAVRRWDRFGLVENICEHGIGHPAHGSALWIAEELVRKYPDRSVEDEWESQMVHGCDGCCEAEDWPGWRESLVKAHEIIRSLQEELDERSSS